MHIFKQDLVEDVISLRKKLLITRIVTFLLFVGLVFSPFSNIRKQSAKIHNHVIRIKIDEIINYNIEKINKLVKIENEGSVKAVVLHVNSPGGTFGGSEAYYRALKRIAAKKPLIVVMDEMAASGGYLVSLPAERIFALNSTITGSIGVIREDVEITELMKKLGITPVIVKSSELKRSPNPMEKFSLNSRHNLEKTIDQSFQIFKGLVQQHRKLSDAKLLEATNGSGFLGVKAIELGLIDQIGDEYDALIWLKEHKKIDLPIIDYELNDTNHNLDTFFKRFQSAIKNIISLKGSQIMTIS